MGVKDRASGGARSAPSEPAGDPRRGYPPLELSAAERRALVEWLLDRALDRRSAPPPPLERSWRHLPALAEGQGLSGLIAARVDAALPAELPPELRGRLIEALRESAARSRARDRALREDAERIEGALSAQGISWRWLKGAWLAPRLYPEPGGRPRADLDLWVAEPDLDRARRALTALGYRPRELSWKHERWQRPGDALVDRRGEHPDNPRPVELHPRACEAFRGTRFDLTPAPPVEPGSTGGAEAAGTPAWHLALVAAHATVDLLERRLRAIQLIDLQRLSAGLGPADWSELRRLAARPEAARFLWPALALARREAGADVPEAELAWLSSRLPPRLGPWLARQDLDALGRFGRADRRRDLLEVPRIWPLTPRESLRLWRAILWPGRWRLADRQPRLAASRLWPLLYLGHLAYLLATLWRRLRLRDRGRHRARADAGDRSASGSPLPPGHRGAHTLPRARLGAPQSGIREPRRVNHDKIAVVDFGGQYAHLIATKVRRLHVLAEIRQPEDPIEAFEGFRGIILSGSPSLSAFGEDAAYNKAIFDLDLPILGFCFGHQEIAKHYGGQVEHGGREWGYADLHLVCEHPLFEGLAAVEPVWMSHYDSVSALGPGFQELGYSTLGGRTEVQHRYAAIASDAHRRYGFQFHPEVDDTVHGAEMIANFVLGICGCEPSWTMEQFLAEELEKVRRQVGDRSVFLLVSGGVDSSVAAVLLGEALGPERLRLLHVDNGMMRKGESEAVLEMLGDLGLGDRLAFVDASQDFLDALQGITEPEAKRRAIGTTFVEVFEREARRLGISEHLLAQGTIYPDTIETGGTKRSVTIKTHHNRVPVIEEMIAAGRVIEPLAELYKVEVRELGERLGLPHEAVWRHPFPGPGLGVRLLCWSGEADRSGFDTIEPALAAIAAQEGLSLLPLPLRSVGVKSDLRAYEHPVLISGQADWPELLRVAGTVYKQVAGINRCIWNLGPSQPASARPLQATMTRERLDLLREADAEVMAGLRRHDIESEIWQCPTVLVPVELDGQGRELVVLRPINSSRGMTATPYRLPEALLDELRARLLALPGVSGLALDLTTKPPGTIEWE